ncbi:MAG: M24 family metallopeptidase [Candidatus Woesearchaeota archaeon]
MLHFFINSSEFRKDPGIVYLTGYAPGFCILAYDDISKKICMFIAEFELGMYKGIKCFAYNKNNFIKHLEDYFSNVSFDKIGINKKAISVYEMNRLKKILPAAYIDNSAFFFDMRKVKSKKEIMKISEACKLTDEVFKSFAAKLKSGKLATEIQAAIYIKKKVIEKGLECAFEPIVASGKNTSMPHHIPSKQKLNGFVMVDFGVKFQGYCSDITRMLYLGNPTSEEISDYNMVLELYSKAFSSLKSGVKLNIPDRVVRDRLGKAFSHSLGHGIGVEVHELPSLSPKSKESLKEGMVFTLEPGYYIKGKYGIRIEDTIAFFNGKLVSLTSSSKKLIILK